MGGRKGRRKGGIDKSRGPASLKFAPFHVEGSSMDYFIISYFRKIGPKKSTKRLFGPLLSLRRLLFQIPRLKANC